MDRSSSRAPLHRRWHARIERYTPDGALGRFLLGSIGGTIGLWLVALALFDEATSLLEAPFVLGLGLPLLLFSIVVLWPVYLSLIGTLESADAYSVSARDPDATDDSERTDDPIADLKAAYANGELTEAEFERRLESQLGPSSRSEPSGESRTDSETWTERR